MEKVRQFTDRLDTFKDENSQRQVQPVVIDKIL